MSKEYISSDFMEIRHHLAHYVTNNDVRKMANYRSTYAGAKYDSGARKALANQQKEAEKTMVKGLHGSSPKLQEALKEVQQAGRLAYKAYLMYKQNQFNKIPGAGGRGDRDQQNPKEFIKAYERLYNAIDRYSRMGGSRDNANTLRNLNRLTGGGNETNATMSPMLGFDTKALSDMDTLYTRVKKIHTPPTHTPKPDEKPQQQHYSNHALTNIYNSFNNTTNSMMNQMGANQAHGSTAGMPTNIPKRRR